jgi:hypothetical protein
MKNKMTGVEWLVEQFKKRGYIKDLVPHLLLEQTKEIEKEQKIEFAKHCLNKALDTDIRTAYQDVEKYYNELYGTTNGSTIS